MEIKKGISRAIIHLGTIIIPQASMSKNPLQTIITLLDPKLRLCSGMYLCITLQIIAMGYNNSIYSVVTSVE